MSLIRETYQVRQKTNGTTRRQRICLWCHLIRLYHHQHRRLPTTLAPLLHQTRNQLRVYQASVLSVPLYGSECWAISTSLCSILSAFVTQAQVTVTKWFDSKTNMEVPSYTKRQPIQWYRCILHNVASAGLAIYSCLRRIILPTPSTPSTRGQRDGQDPVEPLARDGVTPSATFSNSWGQHCWRLLTSPSIVNNDMCIFCV